MPVPFPRRRQSVSEVGMHAGGLNHRHPVGATGTREQKVSATFTHMVPV